MKRVRQKIKNQNRPKIRFCFGTILVLCIMAAIVGSSTWQIWKLHSHVEEQLAYLNQEKIKLLEQEKLLHAEIAQLKTPSFIEKLAREQLGLVKRGEILISPKN